MSTKVVKKKLTDLPVYTPNDTSSGSLHYREGGVDYQMPLNGLITTVQLGSDTGYTKIGGFFAGEGKESVGNGTASVFSRIQQRGGYDVVQGPNDPKGIVGFTFGGSNNRGSIIMDERGRIQTYAIKDNLVTAARVAVPYGELFGQGSNGWDGHIVHFPFPGGEDDSLHSSLVFLPRTDGGVDLWTRGPGGYGNFDVPYSAAKSVLARVTTTNDFTPAMVKCSVNYTSILGSVVWSPLFRIRTDTSGPAFVGIYMGGNVLGYGVYPYLIQATNISSTPTTATIKNAIRVTSLRDRGDTPYTGDNLTQFGYVYNSQENTLTVYSRDGARSDEATFFPWRYQTPTSSGIPRVTVYQNDNNYLTAEPAGIVYLDIAESLSSNTSIALNDGTIVKTTGAVLRVTNGIAASTKSPVRDSFKQNDAYSAINRGYAGLGIVSVTKTTTGTYSISGISTGTNSNAWKIKSPVTFGNSGLQQYVASIISDAGSTVVIEVRLVSWTYNSTTGVVTRTLGSLIDIPVDGWVDIHTTLQ